jgi:RNA polymerase sigma-70 factor (ECF subfamily)
MNEQSRRNLFAELITRHQSELFGYIYAVVRDWQDADDLYQSVCLVLWSKFELFRPGSSFFAWARQTAKIEVSNFLRNKPSPSHLAETLRTLLTDIADESNDDDMEAYLIALRRCRTKLGATDDELLHLRYVEDLSTVEIAVRLQRLQQSVSRSLNRIRRSLFECIELELAKQDRISRGLQ